MIQSTGAENGDEGTDFCKTKNRRVLEDVRGRTASSVEATTTVFKAPDRSPS